MSRVTHDAGYISGVDVRGRWPSCYQLRSWPALSTWACPTANLEGLNSKIRLINHRGYGYHSAMIAMMTHSGPVWLWRPKRVCAAAAYQTKLQLTTLSLGDGWIGAL